MYLNQFEKSIESRLQQVLHTLESVHGITLKIDLETASAETSLLECKATYENHKNSIIKNSPFNTYQTNPEYTKSMLILEAVQLMLTEIAPKRRRTKKVTEGRMGVADYIRNGMIATGSAGTGYDRVQNAMKEISQIMPSFHVSKEVAAFVNAAWDAFAKVPHNAVGSEAFREVHTQLANAIIQIEKEWKASNTTANDNTNTAQETMQSEGLGDTWQRVKKSSKEFWKGTPEELEQERRDADAYAKHKASKMKPGTKTNEDNNMAGDNNKYLELGRAMMKYVDTHQSDDDNELRKLNAFAAVGEKLVTMGQPGGAVGLTDQEQKIARLAQLRIKGAQGSGSDTNSPVAKDAEDDGHIKPFVPHPEIANPEMGAQVAETFHRYKTMKPKISVADLKKHVKEGSKMINKKKIDKVLLEQDQEELAKAQTILAAKDMSSKIQGMAEDVASMAVEDLMPLVDVMRSQFGPQVADGFNQSAKGALETLLNTTTQSKEQFDRAVETLSSGGMPQQQSDLAGAEPPMDDTGMGMDDMGDQDSVGDMANGMTPPPTGPEAPLGREKKDGLEEAWKNKSKGPSNPEDSGKWKNKTIAELKSAKAKLMKKEKRSKEEQKKVSEIDFAIRAKHKKDKWGSVEEGIDESKRTDNRGCKGIQKPKKAKACTQCGKKFSESFTKCKDHKGMKALIDETNIKEKAPPGKKAEDFIKGSKAKFKKEYGKGWEKKLYATAWKQFGEKTENFIDASKVLTECKKRLAVLETRMINHKKTYKKLVSEGTVTDPLNIGYGLDGEIILNRIKNVNKKIVEAKKVIVSEMKTGILEMLKDFSNMEKSKRLAEVKEKTPYGVIYTTKTGQKSKKMFESIETRNYWLDLRKNTIKNVRLIEPETFDKAINNIS